MKTMMKASDLPHQSWEKTPLAGMDIPEMPAAPSMSIQEQMDLFLAVSGVVAKAMSNYASSVTGSKWSTAPFAFEADFIVAEIMRAGYQLSPRGLSHT